MARATGRRSSPASVTGPSGHWNTSTSASWFHVARNGTLPQRGRISLRMVRKVGDEGGATVHVLAAYSVGIPSRHRIPCRPAPRPRCETAARPASSSSRGTCQASRPADRAWRLRGNRRTIETHCNRGLNSTPSPASSGGPSLLTAVMPRLAVRPPPGSPLTAMSFSAAGGERDTSHPAPPHPGGNANHG